MLPLFNKAQLATALFSTKAKSAVVIETGKLTNSNLHRKTLYDNN